MDSLFITTLFERPFDYLAWIIIVMFSICLHEYAHARMALQLGDDTAARQGHLSLNPLKQMGWVSIGMLAVIGIAWGSVPVDPRRMQKRWGAALVSFAGPAGNLLLAIVFAALAVGGGRVAGESTNMEYVLTFLYLGSMANAVLFVLNMLPVPMFDGWSVFSILFPGMQRIGAQAAQTVSWVFILLVFATPIGGLIWRIGAVLAGIFMQGFAGLFGLFA